MAPAPSCSAARSRCCCRVVGDDEVGLAVAVDVRHRHGVRDGAGGEGLLGGEGGRWSPGAVVFSSTLTLLLPIVGDDEVGLAVAVDVRHRHGLGSAAGGEGLLGGEGRAWSPRRRRVQQHAHAVAGLVGDDEVGLAVAVDVRHRHGEGIGAGGEMVCGQRSWRRGSAATATTLKVRLGFKMVLPITGTATVVMVSIGGEVQRS